MAFRKNHNFFIFTCFVSDRWRKTFSVFPIVCLTVSWCDSMQTKQDMDFKLDSQEHFASVSDGHIYFSGSG